MPNNTARWGGAGYRSGAGSTSAALLGTEEAEETASEPELEAPETSSPDVAPEPPIEELASKSKPKSLSALGAERWQLAAREMVKPDKDRHELPGWGRRFLRRITLGGYKGLEPEVEWKRRLESQRALAAMPDIGAGTVVVAQPKGGVGKTPVSMMAACALRTFARKSPVVWDCNENAGARWSVGAWNRTVEYLLEPVSAGTVLSQVEATSIDQDDQSYEVIAAPTPPRNLSNHEFAIVLNKLSQRYTQIVIDTGNTVTASNLVNAIKAADVVVVPTDLAPATMGPTLALFQVLEGKWGDAWGQHVIGVETGIVPDPDPEWREFFSESCAEVVTIPFDPHIATKGLLSWSEMSEATKDACRRLAGAITDVYRHTDRNE